MSVGEGGECHGEWWRLHGGKWYLVVVWVLASGGECR